MQKMSLFQRYIYLPNVCCREVFLGGNGFWRKSVTFISHIISLSVLDNSNMGGLYSQNKCHAIVYLTNSHKFVINTFVGLYKYAAVCKRVQLVLTVLKARWYLYTPNQQYIVSYSLHHARDFSTTTVTYHSPWTVNHRMIGEEQHPTWKSMYKPKTKRPWRLLWRKLGVGVGIGVFHGVHIKCFAKPSLTISLELIWRLMWD